MLPFNPLGSTIWLASFCFFVSWQIPTIFYIGIKLGPFIDNLAITIKTPLVLFVEFFCYFLGMAEPPRDIGYRMFKGK